MPQQQATSPVALAQRYARLHHTSTRETVLTTVALLVAVLSAILLGLLIWGNSRPPIFGTVVILLMLWLPFFVGRSSSQQKEAEELYAQLLALVKDSVLPLPLAEQVALLVALPPTTPPPLPALAQARLAQKLAYASPAELTPLPRAPLHAWLAAAETPDELKIALLLALGSLHDLAIRPLAQELATAAPTERLREAALECLKSLEPAR